MERTKAPRTLSIGGATYDLFVHVPHEIVADYEGRQCFSLPLGEKVRVREVVEQCGGGASNTSVGLKRMGCDASFAGILSCDQWGSTLLKNLQKEGVDTSCTTVVEGEVSSFSIVLLGSNGERVILYEPGTNAHLHDATFNREYAQKMDWIYLNHIQEGSCIIQDDITDILTQVNGPGLTWNPGGCQLESGIEEKRNAALLAHTAILLLNEEEAQLFTKKSNSHDALRSLLETGAKSICITRGKEGVVASDGREVFMCPCLPGTQVVDSTGAGDAFGIGITWGVLQGFDLPRAISAGTISAASVVSRVGAQPGLLTDIEMGHRLNQCHLPVERKLL